MAKIRDIEELKDYRLPATDLANLFHVYLDENLQFSFSINRTFNVVGIENMSKGTYKSYRVAEKDTWPLIAYKNYGTPRLWWLVCKTNGVIDPLEDPIEGTSLKILTEDTVRRILDLIKQN